MVQKRSVYLDYSASTPLDQRVLDRMMPYFRDDYGNPSSAHSYGRKSEKAIEQARESLARILHCAASEVVFTGGGTEGDNLALRGVACSDAGLLRRRIVSTRIEHSAVSNTLAQLQNLMGYDADYLPVDHDGKIEPDSVDTCVDQRTCLVSVVYANNEVGTIQPIRELSDRSHAHGAIFHTDAVQAAGQLELNVDALGVDLLTISAHKFYGPKGVGALYVRSGVDLSPAQSGGSQENGRRAGTLNTPLIVGMAYALELAYAEREERRNIVESHRGRLIEAVLDRVDGVHLTGHPTDRLSSHASFLFDGIDGNKLVMHLDMRGVAASSASACKVGNPEPSSVLLALGYDRLQALGSLRLTVSHLTTDNEIDYAVNALVESVAALRRLERRTAF
jgi:cysteine desulfurase